MHTKSIYVCAQEPLEISLLDCQTAQTRVTGDGC